MKTLNFVFSSRMGYSLERGLQTRLVKIKIINQIIGVFAFNSEYVFLKHRILLLPADALEKYRLLWVGGDLDQRMGQPCAS